MNNKAEDLLDKIEKTCFDCDGKGYFESGGMAMEDDLYEREPCDNDIHKLVKNLRKEVKSTEQKARYEYALKGADAVLEDLIDWIKENNPTVDDIQCRVSTMIGRVELKKLDFERLAELKSGEGNADS